MEDPPPYNHRDNHHHQNGDVELSIPPLDPHLPIFSENDDVFTTTVDGDFPFDVDFDFTFDDLSFADNLLLEQPDPNSDPDPLVLSSDISQEWANPNSEESGCNPTGDGGVRVYDCSPVSSEESNFRGKCNSPEIGSSKSNSGVYSGKSCDDCVDDDKNVDYLDLNQKIIKVEHAKSSDQTNKGSSSSDSTSKCVSKSKSKPKRKIEVEHDHGSETRVHKFRRGNVSVTKKNDENVDDGDDGDDDDDKRKARLIRNRESAQLSRQRKKQYVEELEDKVRAMHSTITDLNTKISYFMTENASLRQQLSCAAAAGGGGGAGGVAGHGMAVPGVYPVPPMAYPWMVYPPAYMVKHQGSNVPLVPIPRLKPQQGVPSPKVKRSCETRKEKDKEKSEGKTKKVASVSLLGFLFFMLLFGGIMPMVSVRYGRVGDGNGASGSQKGAVFVVDKQSNNSNVGNGTQPLVASLYVPRNDKLVKIDGNLIIHSVLASEKAMTSHSEKGRKMGEETGLAIHRSYPPYPTPGPGSNNWRRPHLDRNHENGRQRALGSGSADFTPIGSDGKLQQWFREGLAGPMLSSGMCTEVFQFDISPTPGSIVPATSPANITSEERLNSTRPNIPKNRRILQGHAIPFNDHSFNTTEEQNDGLESNKSRSSVVVSVLVDPREVGDGDGEGVIGSKTLPRIFVVVLIDSVKYVTYSCMLPFLGSSSHLIKS
ncbi:hypothetical protein RND81_05G181900 [Saponaria officinalis]|uniref:BZIP domain-containing protein n=1 Tax=Saponaria officinalis TaxID=3572 RepID=A0AAW1KYM1_SAPOF